MAQCRLCHESLPAKHRRTIFSVTFQVTSQLCEVLGYVPREDDELSKYICGFCFTKLNKLSKIEYDISHRLEALKNERLSLLKDLRAKYTHNLLPKDTRPTLNVAMDVPMEASCCSTPKTTEKRMIIHSPTPRKVKKPLVFTPSKAPRPLLPKPHDRNPCLTKMDQMTGEVEHGTMDPESKRKKISVGLFSPDKAKVLFRTTPGGKVKSGVVPSGIFQQIVRNITSKGPNDRIARLVYKSPLKGSIHMCMLKDIKQEVAALCSTKSPILLRNLKPENLAKFSFTNFRTELLTRAPLTYSVVNQIVNNSTMGTSIATAVALKLRNQQMSAVHHVVAQILDHGGATDETINLLSKLGMCVSPSALMKQKKKLEERQKEHVHDLMLKEKEECESNQGMNGYGSSIKSDIIGDNIDISRSPSQMSVDRKRKSWHWFLLVGLERRILNPSLDDSSPISDINTVENSLFTPNTDDCSLLNENFIHHIMQTLVKYVDCLKKYQPCIPKSITHKHINESTRKSDFAVLNLLNKSENKSEDMISILEFIHENYIPHTNDEDPQVIKRKTFGGDVLTNERAYSAQLAMMNGASDYDCLSGVVHRPEGLHRMMNLLLVFNPKVS